MNGFGHASAAANFGQINQNTANFNSTFLSGNGNDFLTRNNTMQTLGFPSWKSSGKISESASANIWTRSSVNPTGPADPWGLTNTGNNIIDDDAIASEAEISESVEAAEEVTGIAEGAEIASSGTPWGFAAIVNQQIGQATSQAISTGMKNQSVADYANNTTSHGLNVGLNASLIQDRQASTIRQQELGGTIGSFFGPVGALIGHAVAGYASVNPQFLDTASSFQGWINPQQTGIVASQSTAGNLGTSTQIDNVDTTNANV